MIHLSSDQKIPKTYKENKSEGFFVVVYLFVFNKVKEHQGPHLHLLLECILSGKMLRSVLGRDDIDRPVVVLSLFYANWSSSSCFLFLPL